MFRMTDWDGAPMSAQRFVSLAAAGGDDDMFTSDLSDAQLQARTPGPAAPLPCLLAVHTHAAAPACSLPAA